MDIYRLTLKNLLRSIDEASLRKICTYTMLTDIETEIIVMTCSKRHDINFIADALHVSTSTLQRKKMVAVEKLLFRLRIKDEQSLNNIRVIVEQVLGHL